MQKKIIHIICPPPPHRASVYEEEDFQPVVYGFRLASEVLEQKALASLKESEDDLLKELKSSADEEAPEIKVRVKKIV